MLVRRSLLLVTVFASLIAGSSCRRESTKKVIGVVPKGTNHIFWQTVHAGALAAADEFGLEIIWNAPQLEVDTARQISIVENLIARRVDGIVLAPVEEDALVGVVERATSEGIPVSIFDSGIKTDKIISYVATNNYDAGVMAARRMGIILEGRGKVGVIGFMPGSASTMDREAGFNDTIAREYPLIQNLGVRFPMADRARAMAEAENMMTANPDLAGLFADNESSTDGTVRAVKQRGAAGKVKIVGFDASKELVDELKAGAIDSIVIQDPFKMGYESTKAVALHLRGEKPPREIDTGSYLVLQENVETPEMHERLFPDIAKWLRR